MDKVIKEQVAMALDLSRRTFHALGIDRGTGEVVEDGSHRLEGAAFDRLVKRWPQRPLVVIEAGGNSAWVQRELEARGCRVWVVASTTLAHAYRGRRKDDRRDARQLLTLALADPQSLRLVHHRGEEAEARLATLKARDCLVRMRTMGVNHVRGALARTGVPAPRCATSALPQRVDALLEELPSPVKAALEPVLRQVDVLSTDIRGLDRAIEKLCNERYPVTARLRQVKGVGGLVSLAFVLAIDDPARFRRSRDVGAYFGLVPSRSQSGDHDPQLGIDKCGNAFLRKLLVQAAHYILGPFGPDTDLRRWGLLRSQRGGASSRKRALVAVARKLAVLLHALWTTGAAYEPLRNARGVPAGAAR
jgi:transposase